MSDVVTCVLRKKCVYEYGTYGVRILYGAYGVRIYEYGEFDKVMYSMIYYAARKGFEKKDVAGIDKGRESSDLYSHFFTAKDALPDPSCLRGWLEKKSQAMCANSKWGQSTNSHNVRKNVGHECPPNELHRTTEAPDEQAP